MALAEFWYNTSFHSAIGMTPFEALYSRPPPSLAGYTPRESKTELVNEIMTKRVEILKLLKQNLVKARNRMTQQANLKRSDKVFEIGAWVYLKLQLYRQLSLKSRVSQKLAKRYCSPFCVLRQIRSVAYELDLPAAVQIHNVFHVSLLKPCHGRPTGQVSLLPGPAAVDEQEGQDVAVLQRRSSQTSKGFEKQLCEKWKEGVETEVGI